MIETLVTFADMITHKMRLSLIVLVGFVAIGNSPVSSGDGAVVDYPADYRSWQHVKSMIIQPGHPLEDPFGGIHHVYANEIAMRGMPSGRYDEGAVFVFDLLEYIESDRVIVESNRLRLDVMQFDAARFKKTGGWGYTTFVGDSPSRRLEQDVVVACFACHKAQEPSGYVFSTYRR